MYPEIAAEWDYQRNGDLKPQDVLSQSNRKVWWVCSEGHTWKAKVQHRVIGQTLCCVCWPQTGSKYSAGEKQLCEFIRENTLHTVRENFRGDFLGLQELDIYVPESHLGIEFNGVYWHDEDLHPEVKDKHTRKAAACASAGTRLVVVWEDDWKDHREVVEEALIKVMGGAPIPEWMTYDSRREGGVRLSE